MEAKGILAAVRSNPNVKGQAAEKMREAAVKLAQRNPHLDEAKHFIDQEMNEK